MGAGGAERVAANLCNAWVARGDGVTLIVTYSGREPSAYALDDRVRLIYLADWVTATSFPWLAQIRRLLALRRLIKTAHVDIVISFLPNVNVACLLSTVGLLVPVLVSEHSYPPKLSIPAGLKILRKLTYPGAGRVIMLTQLGVQWLKASIPKAKGHVLPNPIVHPLPASPPFQSMDNYLLAGCRLAIGVGRLASEKQFEHLLRAFAMVAPQNPNWVLAILGSGPEEEFLKQVCLELGIGNKVLLPGRIGNLGDWYSRSDLFVLSSQFEGFPSVLVEAMSYGCAVVSYDCESGPAEIIRHGHDGVLVDPGGGIPALSEAMGALMANGGERARLGDNAREVRVRFGLPAVLAQWDALFKEVRRA